MSERDETAEGIRDRVQAAGEQAVGDLAQALLENPVLNQALSAAFGAREKAQGAQHTAMGLLNLPLATEVERLERRLRSLSLRLETVEEQLDKSTREMGALRREAEAAEEAMAAKASVRSSAKAKTGARGKG